MKTAMGSDHSLSHSPSWDTGNLQTSLQQPKEEFILWAKRCLRLHKELPRP